LRSLPNTVITHPAWIKSDSRLISIAHIARAPGMY
jgi:hypothetical protein